MKWSAQHPVFGTIRFDGQAVRVENDSLSRTLQRLMNPPDYDRKGVGRFAEHPADDLSRFLAALRYLNLEAGLKNVQATFDPEPPGVAGEPPKTY